MNAGGPHKFIADKINLYCTSKIDTERKPVESERRGEERRGWRYTKRGDGRRQETK